MPNDIRILLVEDTPEKVREGIAALAELGITQVEVPQSIAHAIESLRLVDESGAAAPDLVLLDLNFNRESGFELLRDWRGNPRLRQIPIIVWTEVSTELERNICKYFGVNQVVSKQDGPEFLKNAVQALLSPK